jgi:hypothetical protein
MEFLELRALPSSTFNAPGTYTVYVKDRNGCVSTGTPTVVSALTAAAAVSKKH